MLIMLLRIDTVNGMSKTPKNHPQMVAHHNLFNNTTYDIRLRNNTKITTSDINEDDYTLTPSLRNSMCQERLSELATLSIEKELLIELSKNPKFYDDIIDKFANLKDRRIDLIYKK
jgi:hypothetical protein